MKLSSATSFNLDKAKMLKSGKGLTLSQTTNFNSSILKEFADDNFEIDENGGKLSRMVENTMGKGEIGRYELFLLFPQCFQKICTTDM